MVSYDKRTIPYYRVFVSVSSFNMYYSILFRLKKITNVLKIGQFGIKLIYSSNSIESIVVSGQPLHGPLNVVNQSSILANIILYNVLTLQNGNISKISKYPPRVFRKRYVYIFLISVS